MKYTGIGIFLFLIFCGCDSKDQEMEEVGKIVQLNEDISKERSLEKSVIADAERQEEQILSIDLEEDSQE